MDFRGAVCGLILMILLSCAVESSTVFRNKLTVFKPTVSLEWSEDFPIDYRFRSDPIISEELPVSFENEDGRPKFR